MSSSMRNAIQRRTYRERAQPRERQRLGLLEKHKDYSLRARDFNKKKAQLKSLRQKAADRNEDEFYFGMMSRKGGPSTSLMKSRKNWSGTVDGDRGNRALDVDTARLLKTQDMGYIRTVRNVAAKEVKGLEERVVALGGGPGDALLADSEDEDDLDLDLDTDLPAAKMNKKKRAINTTAAKKIIFADGIEDRETKIRTQADGSDLDVADDGAKNPKALRAEDRQRYLEKLRRRLQHSRKKLGVLAKAENELELQRAKMAKTATSGGTTKSGKKIKVRERKR